MNLEGQYYFKNERWIAKIELLDVLEISTADVEDLFSKLNNRLLLMFNCNSKEKFKDDDFTLEIVDDVRFYIKFKNFKLATSTIFKSIRNKEHFSQSKIADKLNCAKTSYSQYEDGKREPSISTFNKVVEGLGYEWELVLKKR
nr:hypothetical protein GTC16762_32570 [Pigmentibacter ruber]